MSLVFKNSLQLVLIFSWETRLGNGIDVKQVVYNVGEQTAALGLRLPRRPAVPVCVTS